MVASSLIGAIDADKKAMSSDAAMPMPPGVVANRGALSAEHGTIELAEPSDLPRIGDKLEIIVSYFDTSTSRRRWWRYTTRWGRPPSRLG
jgi:D-serine deaminase-like pyridoxal phosphate-dependent protein